MNRRSHASHLHKRGLGLSPLSEDEVEDIYLGALEVLERAGIKVEDPEVMDILSDAGCRVNRENGLCRIPPEIVEDAVTVTPSRIRFCGRDPKHDLIWEVGRSTFMPFVEGVTTVDLETRAVRTSCKQDVADICHLVEFLPEYDLASVSVTPRDRPTETASIHGFDAALRNTTKGINLALLSRHETETVVRMAQVVAGGPEELAERPLISTGGSPVAPLHFNKSFTDFLVASSRARIPTFCISMGMVGATMPVSIAGTMVVGIAEQLAGLVLIQASERGCPAIVGQSTCGFDMCTGLAAVGCPEMALVMAATAQIGRRIGVPSYAAGL
jgi:trimethylamine---corrinoid protein Co-methyltransferase